MVKNQQFPLFRVSNTNDPVCDSGQMQYRLERWVLGTAWRSDVRLLTHVTGGIEDHSSMSINQRVFCARLDARRPHAITRLSISRFTALASFKGDIR
jgi:hypothetical protein